MCGLKATFLLCAKEVEGVASVSAVLLGCAGETTVSILILEVSRTSFGCLWFSVKEVCTLLNGIGYSFSLSQQ